MGMFRRLFGLALLGTVLALGGCSSSIKPVKIGGRWTTQDPFAGKGSPYYRRAGAIPRGGGRYLVGSPYQVAGQWFTPREQPGYDKVGVGSWYGEAFHRRMTSNGEYFDMNMLSAAHATLPLPSYARVTNLANGRSIVVRINDRGPFVNTRIIDLSKRSADALGYQRRGMSRVRVQYIGPAPLDDKGPHLAMMNRKLENGASFETLVASAQGPATADQPVQVAEAPPQASQQQDWQQEPQLQQANFEQPQQEEGSTFIVQVASFDSLDEAERARAELSSIAPVQVYEIDTASGLAYRVQFGPFHSRISARQAMADAKRLGYTEMRLTQARIEQVAWKK